MDDNAATVTDMTDHQSDSHEVRTLRWKAKQLGKQLGRAGTTIFQLRSENAALRSTLLVTPGDYQRVLAQKREVEEKNRQLEKLLREIKIPIDVPEDGGATE